MKIRTSMHTILSLALVGGLALTACGDSDENDDDDGADTGDSTGQDTTDPDTSAGPGPTDPDTSAGPGPDTSAGPEETAGPEESGDSESGGDDDYMFADDPYDAYTQIDRHAAVEAGTAGIAAPEGLGFNRGSDISIRDEYNASNPAEDADGMWLGEISDSVMFFHIALDDDITGFGFTPATVDQALAQAGPVIVPDTIKYDPSQPTGYPNGRRLEDPVVDITLAAVLLQLGAEQPLSTFADLPLNPPENDVPFAAEFPYLAPPH
ncbi:MAG TPA: DUF4331 family protein [Nannocystaceae bacterium]|nr:DUF4331 family protein [Nannocystaceae bacterium]